MIDTRLLDVIPAIGATLTRPTRRAVVAGACGAAALAAASGVAPLGQGQAVASEGARADQVVIYHTNDVHGHLQGDGSSAVGIDYVAALHASAPNSLLVDAGDATQGMPVVSLSKGASAIELMNAAGYDAMCLGNHEFDFGQEVLLTNAEAAEFPMLSANVVRKDSGDALLAGVGACGDGATAVLECTGRHIGVFGITTASTSHSTSPANVEGLQFEDEVEAAQRCIADLAAQGVDAIVALCHLGDGPVSCRAVDLAAELEPEEAAMLCAIVDGHSHTVENIEANGVLVAQTGCNLANVGKLTLAFDDDGSVSAIEELLDPETVAQATDPAPEVAEVLAEVSAEQEALMAQMLFDTPTTLWAGWLSESAISAPTRAVETNLGDVVCDAFRAAAGAYLEGEGLESMPVVAVENGGGIREAFARGMVSMGNLVATFPFSNTVVLKKVTPRVLRDLFEGSFSSMAGQDEQTGMLLQEAVSGGFLQMAGCDVVCDPNAEAGARVQAITLEGAAEPLDLGDDETPLLLVSNSYVMAGGDSYAAVAGIDPMADLGGELEILQNYLVELAGDDNDAESPSLPLYAGTLERLQLRGGYEPAGWVAVARLVDGSGAALPGYAATLEVDASERFDVQSDENGLVYLDVSDGSHAVCLVAADGGDVVGPEHYVNNYLGYGLVEDELRSYPEIVVAG